MNTAAIRKLLESIPKTWLWVIGGIGYIGLFVGAAMLFNQFTKRVEDEGVAICNTAQLERDLQTEKDGRAVLAKENEALQKRVAERKVEEVEKIVFQDRVITKTVEVEKIVLADPVTACEAKVSDATREALRIISEDARKLD